MLRQFLSKYSTLLLIAAAVAALLYFSSAKPCSCDDVTRDEAYEPVQDDMHTEVEMQRASINTDMQEIHMRKQTRLKAGWRARDFNRSELIPPKSRRG